MLKLHVLKPRDTWKVPPDVGPSSRMRWPLDFSTVISGADLIVIGIRHFSFANTDSNFAMILNFQTSFIIKLLKLF